MSDPNASFGTCCMSGGSAALPEPTWWWEPGRHAPTASTRTACYACRLSSKREPDSGRLKSCSLELQHFVDEELGGEQVAVV